jgi:hypothetical protein
VTLTVTLPSKAFDELCRRAREQQCSLAEYVRRELGRREAARDDDR